MLCPSSRILAVVGHYGCGKTNLAVNLALDRRAAGRRVALADLDIVNPYFRSADFSAFLQQRGIEVFAPVYANTNLDIPALSGRLDGLIDDDCDLILDVGGDAAGAAVLGRYRAALQRTASCELLYAVNFYRPSASTPQQCVDILAEIQQASRMQATGIVNCSHLMEHTTPEGIAKTHPLAEQTADACHLPLCFTAALRPFVEPLRRLLPQSEIYATELYVKKLWE